MIVEKWDESPIEIDDVVRIKDDKQEVSGDEHYEDEMKDEVTSLPDTQNYESVKS